MDRSNRQITYDQSIASNEIQSPQDDNNIQMPFQKTEIAVKNLTNSFQADSTAPKLINQMNVSPNGPTSSGSIDLDYPLLLDNNNLTTSINNFNQIKLVKSTPVPPEIINQFRHVECHSMIGLFPEIKRAWLTVDNDLYIWCYEGAVNTIFFDGVKETILYVELMKPKPGVFHEFIKYLLVLITGNCIQMLAITFSSDKNQDQKLELISDPVFVIPMENIKVTSVASTDAGRLFLGSKIGILYEVVYQAESSWFSKRCKIVNLSTNTLTYYMPSFFNAFRGDEEGLIQVVVDNTRNILYTLSEQSTIEVYDLGEKSSGCSKVASQSLHSLVTQAKKTVKTLDSMNFHPLVSISAIESYESNNLNLVAVNQGGIRFYFSATGLGNIETDSRPYCLILAHVRMPPGFSANIRPRNVHTVHYRDRNLLMISNVKNRDVLWCVSSDLFGFNNTLMETYSTVDLDGPALALAEDRNASYFCTVAPDEHEALPPLVRQHLEPPKRYIILTSHSIQIFIKLRPVDVLKQILKDSHGQDTEVLNRFFAIQQPIQACVTSLILASLEAADNDDVAELATRTFLLFGGEPKAMHSSQCTRISENVEFRRNNLWKPATLDPSVCVFFSEKHNGLYLYLARILRPLWNRPCIEQNISENSQTIWDSNIVRTNHFTQILNNLTALHNFLLLNTHLAVNYSNDGSCTKMLNNSTLIGNRNQNSANKIAEIEERISLDALKGLVCRCRQILGFWIILLDHNLDNLINNLPVDQQQLLSSITFKDLFIHRDDICTLLLNTLINSYLGDNASIDSISSKLRNICPDFYKPEDAALSKASELLTQCRNTTQIDQQEEMLTMALEICKNVAPNINLSEISKQFIAAKAYGAVIELCTFCAEKVDPGRIGICVFNMEDEVNDKSGYNYYEKRMIVYNEISNMLEIIYNRQEPITATSPDPDFSTNKSILLEGLDCSKVGNTLQDVINEILLCQDELIHVTLYDWMIGKQLIGDLIKIKQPSLEKHLQRSLKRNVNYSVLMDILWKYYENNNNHSAAAKVLNNLASRTGTHVTLKERLAYLARAIMCMRSDKIGFAPQFGVFLRDLEDKMEVARVQEYILDEIINLRHSITNPDEAIATLNNGLFEISQLYEHFAEPLKLYECQLAIIDCAGYSDDDNTLVKSIWQQILTKTLKNAVGSPSNKLNHVVNKVKHLSRLYLNSTNCFPLDYLIGELEMINAKLKGEKHVIVDLFVSVNVPFLMLIQAYSRLIVMAVNMDFWQLEENEFHLAEAVAALITCFINNHETVNSVEKRKVTSVCQDTLATTLSELYSRPHTNEIISRIRDIQAKLQRI